MYDMARGRGSGRIDHHTTVNGRDDVEQRGWYSTMRSEVMDVRVSVNSDSEADPTFASMHVCMATTGSEQSTSTGFDRRWGEVGETMSRYLWMTSETM
jgi:hypothetical protein